MLMGLKDANSSYASSNRSFKRRLTLLLSTSLAISSTLALGNALASRAAEVAPNPVASSAPAPAPAIAPPGTPQTTPAPPTPPPPAKKTDDVQSVTLIRHANKAADYYNAGDWTRARDEYRIAIGLSPRTVEFYEGLFNACFKAQEWDQVAFALDELFKIDPAKKQVYAAEYGEALFYLNKYDEAETWLKKALVTANLPTPNFTPKLREIPLNVTTATLAPRPVAPPVLPHVPDKPKAPEKAPETYNLSYENAIRSESIVLATYNGYDKTGDIHWNNPAIAHYTIEDCLKGPPLNRSLPLKYEFHDPINTAMPKGWKFGPDVMPEKGSKWILFIEFSVPKQGAFETFQGSYGRQLASEDNLNTLYSLMDAHNMRLQKGQ